MRLRNRLTTNTEVESEALPRSTRRRFLTYLDVGAASTALVSGAQALSPVAVLVGHSYGGAVSTNAGAGQPNVIGLVYASAIAPDLGEKLGQFQLGPGAANLYPVTYGALPRCAGEGTLLA